MMGDACSGAAVVDELLLVDNDSSECEESTVLVFVVDDGGDVVVFLSVVAGGVEGGGGELAVVVDWSVFCSLSVLVSFFFWLDFNCSISTPPLRRCFVLLLLLLAFLPNMLHDVFFSSSFDGFFPS